MEQKELEQIKREFEKYKESHTAYKVKYGQKTIPLLIAEVEQLQAEIERLKQYTDPKLFAAASEALDAYDNSKDFDDIGGVMERLDEAVTWWDSLPWKPGDGGVELPKYDPGPDSRNQA
jgi:hypothetical protein